MSIANVVFTDLTVAGRSDDADSHPDYLCAYDTLAFIAVCRNESVQATRSFHVTFRLSGGEEHSERVEGLSPGESQMVAWYHDALPVGTYDIYVEFDANERIQESDENDNSYTHRFSVYGGQAVGHAVELPDETVTGDYDAEADGWRQIDVTFVIRDPKGAPIRGYGFATHFYGPEQEETTGGDGSDGSALESAGILRCPNVWLKPNGTVRLVGVADGGAGPQLEGIQYYQLEAGATSLAFEVAQGHEEIEVTASSSREANEKVSAEGHAGLTFEVVELGGSVGAEVGSSHTEGREMTYRVLVGTPTLTLTQAGAH
jgi:hypothetical protein